VPRRLPVDDTALAVTDTGGPGIPVVYLNGNHGAILRKDFRAIAEAVREVAAFDRGGR
jgi:hypothetical protein